MHAPSPPSTERVRGAWRRRLFWLWIAATIAVAAWVVLAQPFIQYFGEGYGFAAWVVPPLMILMGGAGLAWLAALVFSKPKRGAAAHRAQAPGRPRR